MKYYGNSGDMYQQADTVAPNSRYTFAAHGTPDMPPGDYSAVIESANPVVAAHSTFATCAFTGPDGRIVVSKVAYGANTAR